MAEMDTAMLTTQAGVREVTSESAGYRRVRRGRGFSYIDDEGGTDRQLAFSDRRLSRLIGQCQELGRQTLFSHETPEGRVASVSSTDVNEYLADAMNGPFTATDFRTWGASAVVAGEIAHSTAEGPRERLLAAIDVAAERLGNSRDVCRDSYIHPILLSEESGSLVADAWARARSGEWLDRAESALRRVLDESGS